jgi:hypothetical protein
MLLSGIYYFRQSQAIFPLRSVAGMTKLGVLQLAHNIKVDALKKEEEER